MAYAILGISKFNLANGGWSALGVASRHNNRERDAPNADPERRDLNRCLVGSGNAVADVKARHEAALTKGIRSNAVLAVEHVLAASPEWFEKATPDQVQAWVERNLDWLRERFGADNLVSAHLHLDEATPHIHAVTTPIDEKGHLNATKYYGRPQLMREMHTSYAGAMKEFGLERGIMFSGAKHQEVRDWYRQMMDEYQRQREQKQQAEQERTEREPAQRMSGRYTPEQQAQYDYYKQVADYVRPTDLAEVARGLGGKEHRSDKNKWEIAGHTINIRGQRFYDFDAPQHGGRGGKQRGHGGDALDLVMHVRGLTFRDACNYLLDTHYAGHAPMRPGAPPIAREPQPSQAEQERGPFVPPIPDESRWPQVRNYLVNVRRLPAHLVDAKHDAGDIYAMRYDFNDGHRTTSYTNAVFLRRDDEGNPVGAAWRSVQPGSDAKGMTKNTHREDGYFTLDLADEPNRVMQGRLVIVESGIDALSYRALKEMDKSRQWGLIVSTDGKGALPFDLIDEKLAQRWQIRAAFDKDDDGRQMWDQLRERYPTLTNEKSTHQPIKRELPSGHDWNDDLTASLMKGLSRGPGPGPQRGHVLSRGPSSHSHPDDAPPGLDVEDTPNDPFVEPRGRDLDDTQNDPFLEPPGHDMPDL